MKILMITEKDAANVSLAKIADAFIKRKHEVVIYAPYFSDNVLGCFDKGIARYPFVQLSQHEIDDCDCIFTTATADSFFADKNLLTVSKPIFAHNYLINKQIAWGGDICFVASLETARSYYDPYLKYIRFASGEPKYDTHLIDEKKHTAKQFLFIDSGHYPFSENGKRELARTLVAICERFPECRMVIKPRFLPKDKVITHRNSLTLYDILIDETAGKIPNNMEMLMEHSDLMTLITKSDTVICLYTTAFAGTVAAHKGLVIMEGFDSEDVYDVREKTFYRIRENMKGSNALVHYTNVFDVLPEGVKSSQEYKNFLFSEDNNVADHICEATEYFCKEFYDKNLFPDIVNCDYQDYKKVVTTSKELNWDNAIALRKRNYLVQRILIHLDFHINATLDIAFLNRYIDSLDFANGNFADYLSRVPEVRSKIIIENKEAMIENDIDAGALLNAFYILKQYDEIINFPKTDIGAYFLFLGFAYADMERLNDMVPALIKYFEISNNRAYIKEISDMSNNRFRAFELLIDSLVELGEKEKAQWYYEKMKEYYLTNYRLNGIEDSVTASVPPKHYDLIKKFSSLFGHM